MGELHAKQAVEIAERCGEAKAAAHSHHLLAWWCCSRGDYAGARAEIELSLSWARKIEDKVIREGVEAGALVMAAAVAGYFYEVDKEREILQQVLSRADARSDLAGQANALVGLLDLEQKLGFFDQMTALAQRMLTLARSMGSSQRAAASLHFLGLAAESLGDHTVAIRWYEQCLPMCRVAGDRPKEALTLFGLGRAHLESGDAAAALQWHGEAHAIFEHLGRHSWTAEKLAHYALCQSRLSHRDAAVESASQVLDRLHGDLAHDDAAQTILPRWYCHQVLREVWRV